MRRRSQISEGDKNDSFRLSINEDFHDHDPRGLDSNRDVHYPKLPADLPIGESRNTGSLDSTGGVNFKSSPATISETPT